MLHPLVRWIGRRGLRWFYRDVTILGAERIPRDGPVLLVGNHPNDLPDALIGYLATPRPVRYVATAAAATSAVVRWTYAGLGIIAVTRVRDARKMRGRGTDMTTSNRAAFVEVAEALRAGGIVGVFPEGGVHAGPNLGPLRSGVARMVLDSAPDGAIRGLRVVPIGVHYEDGARPRTAVIAQVGEPLHLDPWLKTVPDRRSAAFTAELRSLLLTVSRTASSTTEAWERDTTIAAVAGSLGGDEHPMTHAQRVQGHWRELSGEPGALTAVADLAAAVTRAGGCATSPNDLGLAQAAAGASGAPASRAVLRSAFGQALLHTPWGLPALLLHAPAFAAAWWLSGRVATAPSDRAARTIVPGLYLILLWYGVLGALFALVFRGAGLSAWLAVPVVMALPRLGDLAMTYRDHLGTLRLAWHVRRWPEADRAAIRASVHVLREAWTSHTQGSAVSAHA